MHLIAQEGEEVALHDSVIASAQFRTLARRVMEDAYEALNGFPVGVG